MAKDKAQTPAPKEIDLRKEKELIELILTRCHALDYLIEKNAIAFVKAKNNGKDEEKEKIKTENAKLRHRHNELKDQLSKIAMS